jgi:hypothetical protein
MLLVLLVLMEMFAARRSCEWAFNLDIYGLKWSMVLAWKKMILLLDGCFWIHLVSMMWHHDLPRLGPK